MNDFRNALGFMIMGFVLSGSLAMIIVGVSFDNQLKMYKWDHDIELLDDKERLEYNTMSRISTFLSFGGLIIFFSGFGITTYLAYKTR